MGVESKTRAKLSGAPALGKGAVCLIFGPPPTISLTPPVPPAPINPGPSPSPFYHPPQPDESPYSSFPPPVPPFPRPPQPSTSSPPPTSRETARSSARPPCRPRSRAATDGPSRSLSAPKIAPHANPPDASRFFPAPHGTFLRRRGHLFRHAPPRALPPPADRARAAGLGPCPLPRGCDVAPPRAPHFQGPAAPRAPAARRRRRLGRRTPSRPPPRRLISAHRAGLTTGLFFRPVRSQTIGPPASTRFAAHRSGLPPSPASAPFPPAGTPPRRLRRTTVACPPRRHPAWAHRLRRFAVRPLLRRARRQRLPRAPARSRPPGPRPTG